MRLGYGCTIHITFVISPAPAISARVFASLLDASAFAEQKTRQTFDTACGRRSRRQRRENPRHQLFEHLFARKLLATRQQRPSVLHSLSSYHWTHLLLRIKMCSRLAKEAYRGVRVFERRRNGCCSRAVVIRAVPVLLDTGLACPIVAPPPTTPNAFRSARLLLLRTRSGLGCRSSLDRTEETGHRFRLFDRIGPNLFFFPFLLVWGFEFIFTLQGKAARLSFGHHVWRTYFLRGERREETGGKHFLAGSFHTRGEEPDRQVDLLEEEAFFPSLSARYIQERARCLRMAWLERWRCSFLTTESIR